MVGTIGSFNFTGIGKVNTGNIVDGAVTNAKVNASAVIAHSKLAGTVNGANGVVQLTAGGALPALDGSSLTGISQVLKYLNSGTNIVASHDASAQTSSASYVKLKTITLDTLNHASGNTTFSVKITGTRNPGWDGWMRIYVNGVATGTERYLNVDGAMSWTESITASNGDLIQIYAKSQSGNMTNTVFQVLGSLIANTTNTTP